MPKCILVVDDDRVNTLLVKNALLTKGYEVLTAGDGLEALDVIKMKKPDLILLDVQMPNLDGYGFVMKKIANPDPAISKIPVIVLSAMGKTEPLFKRHGVKAYLLKPIVVEEMLAKIQAVCPD